MKNGLITMNRRISIHAPTRGATIELEKGKVIMPDFNPRSYKRSDNTNTKGSEQMNISIHAPTRGATIVYGITGQQYIISIHAPTRGATTEDGRSWANRGISIHAPTRGATSHTIYFPYKMYYFNPRSYKRSDLPGKGRVFTFFNFNPRSYKRSDPKPKHLL